MKQFSSFILSACLSMSLCAGDADLDRFHDDIARDCGFVVNVYNDQIINNKQLLQKIRGKTSIFDDQISAIAKQLSQLADIGADFLPRTMPRDPQSFVEPALQAGQARDQQAAKKADVAPIEAQIQDFIHADEGLRAFYRLSIDLMGDFYTIRTTPYPLNRAPNLPTENFSHDGSYVKLWTLSDDEIKEKLRTQYDSDTIDYYRADIDTSRFNLWDFFCRFLHACTADQGWNPRSKTYVTGMLKSLSGNEDEKMQGVRRWLDDFNDRREEIRFQLITAEQEFRAATTAAAETVLNDAAGEEQDTPIRKEFTELSKRFSLILVESQALSSVEKFMDKLGLSVFIRKQTC